MKATQFIIKDNTLIADKVYRMCLEGNTDGIRAGQFVEIAVPNQFLRRPISVCDVEGNALTLIYKVVGEGTRTMASMPAGTQLDILTCLGNGYNINNAGKYPLLVGGGVGVPPLYYLAKQLRSNGTAVRVILGFNTASEIFYEQDFRDLGCEVVVTTADGSYGQKGFVTAALDGQQTYYYACGPLPMLKALIAAAGTHGEVSMEERMGCGYGICVGCTIQTRDGNKRVCKEGPVFDAGTLLW